VIAAKLIAYEASPLAFLDDLIVPSAHGPQRFGDIMAPFQRRRFESIAPAFQSLAVGSKPAIGRHWWEATKGASKDSDLAAMLLWLLAFSHRPLACQVGAADSDQAGEMRKAADGILRLNEWIGGRVLIQASRLMCKASGAMCEIIAADTAGSHGARPDLLILNELSHVTKREFAENLMDNAAKCPGGVAVVATNAGFTGSWQWDWRELARTSLRWNFSQYAQPSPWLDPEEIAEAKQRNSNSRYLRLWHGVWPTGTGDAIDPEDIAACIVEGLEPILFPSSGWSYYGGLDLGVKHDHSAFAIIGRQQRTSKRQLIGVWSWAPGPSGKIDLMDVENTVRFQSKRFRCRSVGYDPHQAALMAQRLKETQVAMNEVPFTGKNLDAMASVTLETFRGRDIELFHHKQLIDDLHELTIVEKPYGYRLDAQKNKDGHGDRATAFIIAMLEAKSGGSYTPFMVA